MIPRRCGFERYGTSLSSGEKEIWESKVTPMSMCLGYSLIDFRFVVRNVG